MDPFNAAFCWGHNSNGQLGDNTTISRLTPVRVRVGAAFRRVFTAGFHSCGATLGNRGYCWGRNEDGQLGDGTTIQKRKPTLIAGNHRFTQVFVGAAHGGGWSSNSCGLTADQRAYCWGDNFLGQIGDGTAGFKLIRTSPVAVLGGLQFSGLNTSGVATCGVTTANRAYCWGSDGNFQVGDGNSTQEQYTTLNAVTGGLQFAPSPPAPFIPAPSPPTMRHTAGGITLRASLASARSTVAPVLPPRVRLSRLSLHSSPQGGYYLSFLTVPFFQNGRLTTSAGICSPRHSTSNFVPTLAAAAGR